MLRYDETYRFSWLACDIQGWWLDGEGWQLWGGIAVILALISYRGATCIPYWTERGVVL